ncbi:hypothetical protein Hanom_Chr09g00842161 [Helianthus anomalus]
MGCFLTNITHYHTKNHLASCDLATACNWSIMVQTSDRFSSVRPTQVRGLFSNTGPPFILACTATLLFRSYIPSSLIC